MDLLKEIEKFDQVTVFMVLLLAVLVSPEWMRVVAAAVALLLFGLRSMVPKFVCQVCKQRQPVEGSFSGDCPCQTCNGCMKRHVRELVNQGQVAAEQLHCPHRCSQRLADAQVLDWLEPYFQEKFKQLRHEAYIAASFICGGCNKREMLEDSCQIGCGHRACGSCMQKLFQDKLESNLVGQGQMQCPHCPYSLTDEEIGRVLGPDVLIILSAMRQENHRAEHFQCQVCGEEKPFTQCFTVGCDDAHKLCNSCMQQWVQSKVEGREVSEAQLRCPFCPHALSDNEVIGALRRSETPEEFERLEALFHELRLDLAAATNPDYFHRCPHGGCNYLFIWRQGVDQIEFNCQSCTNSFCLACTAASDEPQVGPAHPGQTCEQRREQLERDAEERRKFEEWQQLNARADELFKEFLQGQGDTRACPNCGLVIQRTHGCDHMTCSQCGCHFCLQCGKYNSANPQSRGDCGVRCRQR